MIAIAAVIGLFVLVVAYPFLWSWLEKRHHQRLAFGSSDRISVFTSGVSIGSVNLSAFALSYVALILVVTVTLIWLSIMGPRWHYASTLTEDITACEQGGDAASCLDLALKYRSGVTGLCFSSAGRTRLSGGQTSLVSCRLLSQNQDRAMDFARQSCRHGNQDGCFYAMNWEWTIAPDGVNDAQIRDVRPLCNAGAFAACDFLTTISRAPRSDPVLPPDDIIRAACDAGNQGACLHSLKERALRVISNNNVLENRDQLIDLTFDTRTLSAQGRLSQYEWEKLKEISDVVNSYVTDLPRYVLNKGDSASSNGTADLVRKLGEIELPMPSFQAERERN